jgi:predicted SAM-dependent methyltransferase
VDEILIEHVLEHLSFAEEALAWPEMARVLRTGGKLTLEVPDFEWVCAAFLAANDEWRDFYITGHPSHYAGCGRTLDQRWGILQTMFFGNQNGAGQFHRTAYTAGKLRALAQRVIRYSAANSSMCRRRLSSISTTAGILMRWRVSWWDAS